MTEEELKLLQVKLWYRFCASSDDKSMVRKQLGDSPTFRRHIEGLDPHPGAVYIDRPSRSNSGSAR